MDIEARFSRIRTEESNLGNLTADLMRSQYAGVDIALANGGCLRANSVTPKGPFSLKFIANQLPMIDKVVVKKIPGHIFKKILENSLSQYPKYDGRWACTSGIKFSFDPEKPAGDRILMDTFVMEDGTPFDLDKSYSVAAKYFLTSGKDGYDDFLDPSIEDLAPTLDEALSIQEIYISFLKNFRKSNEEID